MISLEERFAGAMLGLACGDALGGPAEEIPGHKTTTKRPVTEMVGGGWLKLRPGQITDDTEMTLCILRSIVERGQFDPYDIGKRCHDWFYDSPIGAGKTTKVAMERIHEGLPWSVAGLSDIGKKSLGNGSLMRCAPVGLYRYNDRVPLIRNTLEQGWITHPHKDCQDSIVFYNLVLASIVQGKEKKESFVDALPFISPHSSLRSRYERIQNPLASQKIDVTGAVSPTLETAMRTFLEHDTYESVIIAAVNMGGDADTRAAVAGALAGAYYGEQGIPARWKEQLVDRHGVSIYQELKDLSHALYQLTLPKKQ